MNEGYDNNILSKEEASALTPAENVVPGRFYATFKVHRQYEHGKVPPERAIVSCSGTYMENIAIYVEHNLKDLGTSHESYLKDTPDFLRQLLQKNQNNSLPDNAMLVVIDAIGLYTNIPQDEGVKFVEEAFETKEHFRVPGLYKAKLLEIIIQNSIFEFNKMLYKREIGTSMGTKQAPSYANIFIANKIDKKYWEITQKYMVNVQIPIHFMKRFLDDIFMIFFGSITQLHQFFDDINEMHPTIKFTMAHTTPKTLSDQEK